MPGGTAKASRSATEVNTFGITQAFKRTRVQDEPPAPLLTVTDTTGTTTSNESMETVVDTYAETKTRSSARKLDRLYDKQARFESHKQFLERCLQASVTPRGLQIELEPSIGNHNEEFLAKWNEKLVKFSRELTQDVIEFCDTTVAETVAKIADAKEDLAKTSTQIQLKEITTSLEKNQEDRTRNLRRNKDKKFNKLKYNINRRPARQQYFTSEEEWSDNRYSPQSQPQPRGRNVWQKQDNNNTEHTQQTRTNRSHRNSRSRNNSLTNLFNPRSRNSNTDLHAADKQHDKVKLLERVRQLESQLQNKSSPQSPGTRVQQYHQRSNNTDGQSTSRDTQQKNSRCALSNSPGATPEIPDMVKFITETMDTLKTFKQHLTTLQGTEPTRSGMC